MRTRFPAVMFVVTVAALEPALAADRATQVYIAGGELNYVGDITDEANRRAFALYESEAQKPPVLAIRSPGGVTSDGIALGRWVHAHQLTVKVLDLCFSSCANYVFPAAPHKVVSDFAVVGFHGGLSSDSFKFDAAQEAMFAAMPEAEGAAARAAMLKEVRGSLNKDIEDERAFYAEIGAQQRMTTLGQAQAYQDRYGKDETMLGWYYSVDSYRKLGVNDITVINGAWKPQFTAAEARRFKVFEVVAE